MVAPVPFAGRYRLMRSLGSGAQGEVYEAFDQNEGATVAVKLLRATPNPSLQWVEAIVLRSLQGHHILPIHNADTFSGQPYLVTALARHGSVDKRIDSSGAGLDISTAVAWTREACLGITRGHASGLVHNDIKPANLFINDKDECVVGDWGFAATINPATGTAFCPGATLDTLAPEVAAAWGPTNQTATTRSDVYSLGATAFWMLAGRPPVDLSSAVGLPAALAAVTSLSRPRLRDAAPHVPKRVCDAVDKALAFDPAARFGKPVEFAAALGARGRVDRRWGRTDEHAGHLGCWRGEPTGKVAPMMLCAVQGAGRKVEIRTSYQPTGRAYRNGCRDTTQSRWVTDVRQIIAELT